MERYAAKSRNFVRRYLVIHRSFYGARPLYGCATLLFSLYCKEAVFFYMLMIMTNFEASRLHVVDTHKELFQSSVCCDKLFLASAYHTLSIQILRNYLTISQKLADHLTCQRQNNSSSPFHITPSVSSIPPFAVEMTATAVTTVLSFNAVNDQIPMKMRSRKLHDT